MPDAIVVDVSKATAMFERLQQNADELGPVVDSSARKMLATASGIPVDTGTLAGSLYVRRVGPTTALIVSKVEYARFVFYGVSARHIEPRPPTFSYGSSEFAADVAREAFR